MTKTKNIDKEISEKDKGKDKENTRAKTKKYKGKDKDEGSRYDVGFHQIDRGALCNRRLSSEY